jgi:hypothetical protein
MLELLEAVGMPKVLGFQADMSHTLLYTLGENAPKHRIVKKNFNWEPGETHAALTKLSDALRPWTIDFHVAQNDGSVFGSGSHEKTGRHCQATDPNGKLNIVRDSGYWLRNGKNKVTKKIRRHDQATDLERHPRRHDPGPQAPRLARISLPQL